MAITEGDRLHDILVWEQEKYFSREDVTITSGESLSVGEVVGKIAYSVETTGTAGSNTGNGTMGSVTGGASTKIGVYTMTCTAEASNAGTFSVIDPEGIALDDATVAVAYTSDQINFTIADGSEDFDIGDTFTVTVTAGAGTYSALDLTGTDGTQTAAGFVINDYDASSAAVDGVIIARDAKYVSDSLTWPAGITTAQKNAAKATLKSLGIIEMEEL